jgi:hypothetical protein
MTRARRFLLLAVILLAVGTAAVWFIRQRSGCRGHSASLSISGTAAAVQVGEHLTVQVALSNTGCVALGLPQYRLYVETGGLGRVLSPERPEPVIHSLAVQPGESDGAEFVLQAVAAGKATITASASFEVHLDYPGPAYWGMSNSGPLVVTVQD